jgi:cytosine/uracil/thiamine/allantoin permease
VTTGLSWRSAIGIIALGHFLAALLITANGIVGARLHIPYTIQSRAPFGFFFSFFVVFVRLLVGFFWYGINTYNGALCVYAVLVAIWPSFANVPNHLPESANITTQMLTGMNALTYMVFQVANDTQHTLFTSSSYYHSTGSTHDDSAGSSMLKRYCVYPRSLGCWRGLVKSRVVA